MPRTARVAPGGMVFHVVNRGVGRMRLFDDDADYAAFERVLEETLDVCPMRVCAYCLMPNHWHFVLWPERDGDLATFMRRMTITHVTRWQEHRHLVGTGHVYQGRYKSFPVDTDDYYYEVVRYVEGNALRANLIQRAEEWKWSSFYRRLHGTTQQKALLHKGPLPLPRMWRSLVNRPEPEAKLDSIRQCVNRSRPYGSENWVRRIACQLGLESTIRPRGRPRKTKNI